MKIHSRILSPLCVRLCNKEMLVLGKNAVKKATQDALGSSRQLEVRYVDTMNTTLSLAYLQALVFTKLISLPAKKEQRLNRVFRSMSWGNDNNRTVVITFTDKFNSKNVDLFSQKLAAAIEYVAVVKTTGQIPERKKKSCKK